MSRENRIQKQITNLGNRDNDRAIAAENRVIRFGFRAVPLLIKACRHSNANVRLRAAWCLGAIGDPSAFDSVASLCTDEVDEVAYDSRIALGVMGDVRALHVLLNILDEPNPDRDSAAYGIARLQLPNEEIEKLAESPIASWRKLALYCAQFTDEAFTRQISTRMLQDHDPKVRREAEDSLECLEA